MSETLAAFSKRPDEIGSQPKFYVDTARLKRLEGHKSLEPYQFMSMKAAVLRMYPQELQVPESLRPERRIAEQRVRDMGLWRIYVPQGK